METKIARARGAIDRSHSLVVSTVNDRLGMKSSFTKWVPRLFTTDQKTQLCDTFLPIRNRGRNMVSIQHTRETVDFPE